MKKIYATIIKELILLKRDVAGMMLLLIMPAILIVVMALVQDAPFKDYQEMRFDLLLVDNDQGAVAHEIVNGLKQSKNFHIIDSINDKRLTDTDLKDLLQKGTYKIGIVIPKGTTAELVNTTNVISNNISKKIGLGTTLPSRDIRDVNVEMYFDPTMKPTFRSSIHFALDKYITYACSNILIERISRLGNNNNNNDTSGMNAMKKALAGIGIQERPLNDKGKELKYINSVQHNVPAWAIFGMFFIVVPLSGHMIREREEGSALRIALIPNVGKFVALGRIIFYTIVCAIQFILMICIGLWFIPLVGLPALYLGAHPIVLLPIAICIGFAATSYGYFIGAVFKTANQALPFGSISIVILAALGGIWIPTELLPPAIQHIALVSPLHWGLEAIDQIILRNGNGMSVLKQLSALVFFGISMWLISVYLNITRNQSVQ